MDLDQILFYLTALPGVSALLYALFVGGFVQHRINQDKEFRSQYSGWGGPDFWRDARKINDPKLQRYIYLIETWVPQVIVVGFSLTTILAGLVVYSRE